MKHSHLLFTFSIAICFAVCGAWFGRLIGEQVLSNFDLPFARSVGVTSYNDDDYGDTYSGDGQSFVSGSSYILLGVNKDDVATAAGGSLEAIWTVSFMPDYSTVELKGIAPTPAMQTSFYTRPSEFIASLVANTPAPLRKQLVLDSRQFSWIIDTLGGVRLSGAVLNGKDTLDYIRSGRDSDSRLLRQAAAVQGLVANAALIDRQGAISEVLQKVRPDVISRHEILAITEELSPIGLEHVRVRAVPGYDYSKTTLDEPPA